MKWYVKMNTFLYQKIGGDFYGNTATEEYEYDSFKQKES